MKMGFWDFFKKIISEDNEDESDKNIKTKKVNINELKSWLQTQKSKLGEQEANYLKQIQTRNSQFIQEINEKISSIKEINIDEKREQEKIKIIVKENLDNYIDYLNKLINKLEEINEFSKKEIVKQINSIFDDFNKKSLINFQKAVFLLGRELGEIKETIKTLFKDLKNILEENKHIIDKSKTLSEIETQLKKYSEINEIKSEIETAVKNYAEKLNNLNNNVKIQKQEIENIKKSDKFLAQLQKKEEQIEKENLLSQKTAKLKELIDFKALTNFFHNFEKEMNKIKEYKENFKQTFEKTKGQDLISLFKEANLPHTEIISKIQEIIQKEAGIAEIIIEETGISALESEIKKTKSEIQYINSKILSENKKSDKLKENLNEITKLIKQELNKINVELD